MTTPTQKHMDLVRALVKTLIEYAARQGMVVTIETKPLQPLAQGNYEMVVDVRAARDTTENAEADHA